MADTIYLIAAIGDCKDKRGPATRSRPPSTSGESRKAADGGCRNRGDRGGCQEDGMKLK